ncbi:MAG: hypothetical protein ACK5HT_12285 [Draconibacterium sp.]
MKKNLIRLVLAIFVMVSCIGLIRVFSPDMEAKEREREYFNPEIDAPYDACDTGGQSVCYID